MNKSINSSERNKKIDYISKPLPPIVNSKDLIMETYLPNKHIKK